MHSDGCGCKAEHELASSFICLRDYLNLSSIRVLNSTSDPNSGGLIFKKYGERLSDFHVISDDVETELLFTVPFSQPCDVHNLLVVNESGCVLQVKIYANRPEFDFTDIDTTTPSLKLDIPPDWHGSFVHSLGSRQLRGVENLAIHFLSKEGEVKLRYIGLRGRPLNVSTGVVDVTYEVTPAPNASENLAELRGFRVYTRITVETALTITRIITVNTCIYYRINTMNFIYLFVFITSCSGYTFNKVSIPFNNIMNTLNRSYRHSKSWFHEPNNGLNRSENKLDFSIFAKNPSFERKQRQQRKSKRMKQVVPLEHMTMSKQMDNLVRKSEYKQKRLFGYRLSELPGDGGIIPLLEMKSDKQDWVRNYFSAYEGKDAEYVRSSMNDDKMVAAISANPSKTAGKFKNVDPLVSNFFYQVVERVFGQESFVQATFKKTVASIRRHHVEASEGTQNYYGLEVETLFSQLDPEDMDKLRQIEIQVKSGKMDPSLFSSKFGSMLGSDGTSGDDAGRTADFDE